jgi:hypothetical protein
MFTVLKKLGDVSEGQVPFKNGKLSKFNGKVSSKVGNTEVNLGILHYDWNRSIGVDKINQAIQQTEKAGLDGALMVAPKFSRSAIEQAYRINDSTNKRILLMEEDEINAAFAQMSGTNLNA